MYGPRKPRSLMLALTLLLVAGWVLYTLGGTVKGQGEEPQEPPQPDPATFSIALTKEDMPAGFELTSQYARQIQVPDPRLNFGPVEYTYNYLYQGWTSTQPPFSTDDHGFIQCSYALLPSRLEAAKFFRSYRLDAQIGSSGPYEPKVGDFFDGSYPGDWVFVQDRAFVRISVHGGRATSRDFERAMTDPLLARLQEKLLALGLRPGPPLTFEVTALSQHVNRPRGQQVLVRLTSDQRDYLSLGFGISFIILRSPIGDDPLMPLGHVVFRKEDVTSTGSYEFTWDGRNTEGQDLPNGRYLLRIQARDLLRTKGTEFKDIGIEVNNQG